MSGIAKELRDTADIAEAGNKPHWAKLMRCAAAQLIAGDMENALLLEENKRLEESQKVTHGLSAKRDECDFSIDFDTWHYHQLNGDPDNCPHERWERKAWESAVLAERAECLHIAETTAAGRDAEAIADAIRERGSKGEVG